MKLFVVRHAHAQDAVEDTDRHLSKRGRNQIRAMAAFLKTSGAFDAREVWHSSLARSVETAEALVHQLGLKARLIEVDDLDGAADPRVVAKRVQKRRQSLAIVGHEPHLGALVSLLVAGEASPPRFVLKKCAIVALERDPGGWVVRWQISPGILPVIRGR